MSKVDSGGRWLASSLAGTVIQFIDAGAKFVGLTWKIYHEDAGVKDGLLELEALIRNLKSGFQRLEIPKKSSKIDAMRIAFRREWDEDSLAALKSPTRKVPEITSF